MPVILAHRPPSILPLLLVALGCLFSVVAAQADTATKRVVYINSYNRGYSWSDGIEDALRQTFAESGKQIELSSEYLDSRRFGYGAQIEFLAQAMAVKYSNYTPHLVVVSDNAAFDFAIQHRTLLFPQAPIVFCGYNNFRPEVIRGISNIIGVNEEIDVEDTVTMALKVHPRAHTLAFIISTGDASSIRIAEIAERSVFPKLRKRFDVVVIKDASIEQIRQRLAGLPKDTVVFLSGQTSDRGPGRALSPAENGSLISAASPFPVYSFWDFHLNHGVIGGHIITGSEQGRAAAGLALRVLGGAPPDRLPVIMTTPTRDIFDYKAMKRFGISPDALPPGAQIINRPTSVWDSYRWQIITTIGVLVTETLLLALLWRIARERRRAMEALDEQRGLLENKVRQGTAELQGLNETLDQRVREEVANNLQKERLLIEQSRLATMGEMIGNIAHQWRQPLNILAAILTDIQDAYAFNELNKESLEKNVHNGQHMIQKMSATIDDFRNFFRPNKEKLIFVLAQPVEDAINLIKASLGDHFIAVEVASTDRILVQGYPNELSQVLINLFSNARDAFVERKITNGKIILSWQADDTHAHLDVRDTAGGIPEEILPRIFDPLFHHQGKRHGNRTLHVEDDRGAHGRPARGTEYWRGRRIHPHPAPGHGAQARIAALRHVACQSAPHDAAEWPGLL